MSNDSTEEATTRKGAPPRRAKPPARNELEVVSEDARDRRLLRALDVGNTGLYPRRVLTEALVRNGLRTDDVRIAETMKRLTTFAEDTALDGDQMLEVIRPNVSIIERTLRGNLVIPEFPAFCQEVQEIFEASAKNETGKVATYIPQLARVSPHHFGMALCTVDGQRHSIGDTEVDFSVQSCTKPVNYCIALEELGEEAFHRTVGREPSGRGFNELTLNKDNKPHNPMINAGAIATCSLIKNDAPLADRFDHVMAQWERLSGGRKAGFSNAVYLSERQTADRNFALGYFMKEKGVFPESANLIETLEFYFQCCSIESNCERMSVIAATLANGGVCPITGERVLAPSTVRSCLSLMYSCGMYDFSGEFAFSIGLPSKSGVSGALMVVVPNTMGFCTWSPRLDALGNSVRGIEFCKRLIERFNFHNYDNLVGSMGTKKDPRARPEDQRADAVNQLCWAASQGDLLGIQRLVVRGIDLNLADYDGRTALHLAASEGQAHIVEALLARGVTVNPRDRWGNTPLDDALRGPHAEVASLLEANGGRRGAVAVPVPSTAS
ncbi:MAG: glutaminase A [Kofleriaceae bacterium]|nr:glutaminase A [Kofleriaceae bacterium]